MDTDTIIIHRERMAALVPFITNSVLHGCTNTIEHDEYMEVSLKFGGSVSSGERVLWDLLDDMTTGHLNEAAWRLDGSNCDAVIAAVGALLARVTA